MRVPVTHSAPRHNTLHSQVCTHKPAMNGGRSTLLSRATEQTHKACPGPGEHMGTQPRQLAGPCTHRILQLSPSQCYVRLMPGPDLRQLPLQPGPLLVRGTAHVTQGLHIGTGGAESLSALVVCATGAGPRDTHQWRASNVPKCACVSLHKSQSHQPAHYQRVERAGRQYQHWSGPPQHCAARPGFTRDHTATTQRKREVTCTAPCGKDVRFSRTTKCDLTIS
jgi:hypothetical protein